VRFVQEELGTNGLAILVIMARLLSQPLPGNHWEIWRVKDPPPEGVALEAPRRGQFVSPWKEASLAATEFVRPYPTIQVA
jgi:hypothetical protein